MPRHCCVMGCKSNYKSQRGARVTTFAVPREEYLREQWINQIGTDISKLKNPYVCAKHFQESDIIRVDKFVVKGEHREYPRKIPKLKDGAMPTIFDCVPNNLSVEPSTPEYLIVEPSTSENLSVEPSTSKSKRLKRDIKEENLEMTTRDSPETKKLKQKLPDLEDIVNFYYKSKQLSEWILINENQKINFCLVNVTEGAPFVLCSLVINKNLDFVIYIKDEELPIKNLPKKLRVLSSANFLVDLLHFVQEIANTVKTKPEP